MVLLKADNRPSKDVAEEVGCCEVVVNNWMKRYQEHGIAGLVFRKGRDRRSILEKGSDLEAVRRAVQKNRQKVSLARAELETELGKEFSTLTLANFVYINLEVEGGKKFKIAYEGPTPTKEEIRNIVDKNMDRLLINKKRKFMKVK